MCDRTLTVFEDLKTRKNHRSVGERYSRGDDKMQPRQGYDHAFFFFFFLAFCAVFKCGLSGQILIDLTEAY